MTTSLRKIAAVWIAAFIVIGLGINACGTAKNVQSSANADSLIQAKRFVFVPQSANPTAGRTRQLNAAFALTVTPDTVQSYLPYFGRSYTAPVGSSRGPMDFTLTQFDFVVQPQAEGRWNISIRPRGNNDIRELQLQVFSNGNALLQAFSNNRQPISYNGYIQQHKRR